jgi:DNA-binding IclR family transcriptional regulator
MNALVQNGELSITEIHAHLNLPKSTIFVILNTLERSNFIEKTPDGKFRLGYGSFLLGMSYYKRLDIRDVARPHLLKLVQGTPYTCHLAILVGINPVYIDKVEGDSFIRFATSIGQTLPLYSSGVGKALASGMEYSQIRESLQLEADTSELQDKGKSHALNIETMMEEIEYVKKHGYIIEDELMEEGIRCIGAPIFDLSGKVIASISVTSLSKDLPAFKFHEVGEKVKDTALSISKELGHDL